MKKSLLAALVQFLIVFLAIGIIAYFVKGEFFYRWLSLIFGGLAAITTFITHQIIYRLKPKDQP